MPIKRSWWYRLWHGGEPMQCACSQEAEDKIVMRGMVARADTLGVTVRELADWAYAYWVDDWPGGLGQFDYLAALSSDIPGLWRPPRKTWATLRERGLV